MARQDDWEDMQAACMLFAPLFDRHPEVMPDLVRGFLNRERRKKQVRGTDPARASLRRALTAKPPAIAEWADVLWHLGLALRDRFRRIGEVAALDEALAVLRHATAVTRAADPQRSRRLSGLGVTLQERFLKDPDVSLLREAIEAHRQAATDTADPDHARFLFNLGSSLYSLYEQTGQKADLLEALAADRQAVAETPRDDECYPQRLGNLVICLVAWYQETGKASDLDEAFGRLRSALAGTSNDRMRGAFMLPALGSRLRLLYQETGDLDALTGAIEADRDAMRTLQTGHAQYGQRASRLAGVLLLHYRRTGEMSSLEEAIACLQASVEVTGQHPGASHAGLAALSNNLSAALRERYELTGNPADLDEAIARGYQAVSYAVTPSARSAAHGTLGWALLTRHLGDRDGGPFAPGGSALMEQALDHLREAVETAPRDDPDLAARLSNLGNALLLADDDDGAPGSSGEAGEVFHRAAASPLAPPPIRAEASVAAGRLAAEHADWHRAVQSLAAAVNLLERAIPRSLGRSDREHQLKRLRNLSCDAAACALRAGDAELAAVLSEQGRGVLLAQAIDIPTDLDELDDRLRQRFEKLRREIDGIGTHAGVEGAEPTPWGQNWTGLTPAEHRRNLIGQWDDLVGQIRDLPGLSGFLKPPQAADLMDAAKAGPIALVNASRYGSAALLLRSSGVDAIELPGLSPPTARAMVAELLTALDLEDPTNRDRRLTELLGWLWDAITGPILDHVGLTDPLRKAAPGPRLWWCPSGLLSFLPLHAAGHHATRSDAAPQTVMDRVISSYAPTIRMLMHSRREDHALRCG